MKGETFFSDIDKRVSCSNYVIEKGVRDLKRLRVFVRVWKGFKRGWGHARERQINLGKYYDYLLLTKTTIIVNFFVLSELHNGLF